MNRRALRIAAALIVGTTAAGVAVAAAPLDVYIPALGRSVPAEKAAPIQHALAAADAPPESAVVAPTPAGAVDVLPGHVIEPDVPGPVSPQVLEPTNGWLAADGRRLVAVYAGEAGDGSGAGRFVIVRQNQLDGDQKQQIVDVPGSAPGLIVRATDRGGVLVFRSPNGRSGELDLESGRAARPG